MNLLLNQRYFWTMLIFLSVLSAVVSLLIGLGQSVWFDEAYSVLIAQQSWGDIARLVAQDVHPPVYYWLLKAWITVFGSGEFALRSMSALFLGLSIGVAGLLARRLFGPRVAVTTLFFLALAPFLLRYGFEIRMYSFCSFIGISATYVIIAALDARKKRSRVWLYGLYTFLVIVGVYTLYYMALLWIAHFIWIIWYSYRARNLRAVLPALTAYLFGFVSFLPWLPIFLGKANGDTLSPVTHELGLFNLGGIFSFSLLYRAPWQIGIWQALLLVGIVFAMVYLVYSAFQVATEAQRRYLTLFSLSVLVPVIILIVVTHIRPVYIERYLAHLIIAGYLLVGVCAALTVGRRSKLAYAATSFVMSVLIFGCAQLAQVGNYNFQRLHTPSVNQVAGLLTDCQGGTVIFANDPQVAIELGYYIRDCPVYFYNETFEMGGGYAALSKSPLRVADPAEELRGANRLYYVYYDKPERSLSTELRETSTKTLESLSVATYVKR